ncbi:hypothetical protein BCON_0005g00830 [Botryotinia convoluta]|uniref:Uncharacterized protein n=1 Tax=Botryotinia convoluta TaxID=54673 RepID=A0A4Z1IU70_9HELO|nr:hypothetical protein BCON_0005g00830 [Botryotinia convoluta]
MHSAIEGPASQAIPDDLLTAVGVSDRGERVGTINLDTPDPFLGIGITQREEDVGRMHYSHRKHLSQREISVRSNARDESSDVKVLIE